MASTEDELTAAVKAAARAAGFARVGVACPRLGPAADRLAEWVARGYHAEMGWMAETAALRRDPTALLPGCRSVLALSVPYATSHPLSTEVAPDPARVWISRYAWGDDYHDVLWRMLRRLEAGVRALVGDGVALHGQVDAGPVLERVVAAQAGLGWIGKNACLIDGRRGSFHFLAALLTDLPLVPDAPVPERCGRCTRCLDACPTGALVAPGLVDARRCLAYHTVETRTAPPDELLPSLGHRAFGCDVCQDVCPWNRFRSGLATPDAFAPREGLFHPERAWLEGLWRGEFRRVFKGSPVRRRGLSGLRATLAAMRRADESRGPKNLLDSPPGIS